MYHVDVKKCTGCGLCVTDCFPKDIEMIDDKARINNVSCIQCGHCIAICPANAVSADDCETNEIKEYDSNTFDIDSNTLMNFIQFRRTIRQYKDKDVSNELIEKIIESGRFTQTSSNLQDVSYTVVKKDLPKLRELTLKRLNEMGEAVLNNPLETNPLIQRYAKAWINMYEKYQSDPDGEDRLFYKAPVVIVVTATSPVNGALASSNMELMTNALGLGTVFSGFFVRASQKNKDIAEFLNLKENEQIVTCMVIGYPKIKYQRTVPRKKANISWK